MQSLVVWKRLLMFVVMGLIIAVPLAAAQDSDGISEVDAIEDDKGPWNAEVSFGAVVTRGNSESTILAGQSVFGYTKEANYAIISTTRAAYGRSQIGGVSTTHTNYLKSELRGEKFFSEVLGAFALAHIGYDKPAGFDTRYGAAIGFFHDFIKDDFHHARYELGPDYTHEDRTNNTEADIYSARVFGSYLINFTETASFDTSVELLVNLENTDDTRINNFNKLKFKIINWLSFFTAYDIRVDLEPVPGFEETDTELRVGIELDFV